MSHFRVDSVINETANIKISKTIIVVTRKYYISLFYFRINTASFGGRFVVFLE